MDGAHGTPEGELDPVSTMRVREEAADTRTQHSLQRYRVRFDHGDLATAPARDRGDF